MRVIRQVTGKPNRRSQQYFQHPFRGLDYGGVVFAPIVERAKSWAHFDIYAWNQKAAPGRPEGAEVQVVRLLFDLIAEQFGTKA
jgi:leucyl aminopeptidase